MTEEIMSGGNENASESSELVERKLWLPDASKYFGDHRNTFNRIIEELRCFEKDETGVRLVPFIERYFGWGDDIGESRSSSPAPLMAPWVGFVHVPLDSPEWFESTYVPENIFKTDLWNKSLTACKGLYCFSTEMKIDLEKRFPSIKISSLLHPTDLLQQKEFNWQEYCNDLKIVQVGDWLRKLQSIYVISAPGHRKLMLKKKWTSEFMAREIRVAGDYRNDSVEELSMIPNADYDRLLGSSVVLCLLYGAAANNAVVECIARTTPLIVSPLAGIVEYLGEDYPAYARSIDEANNIIANKNVIRDAHLYLKNSQHLRERISYSAFRRDFGESVVYKNL